MKLKIIHETDYLFSTEVFLEPHVLRFKPRSSPFLDIHSFDLEVFPKPFGIREQTDAENNATHFCWFDGMHKQLSIRSELVVDSREFNPFNFIVHPSTYLILPFIYANPLRELLAGNLKTENEIERLSEYGEKILSRSKNNTLTFLSNLTQSIHYDFTVEARLNGEPYAPEKTFHLKKGSCRDLAWMQIQLLRSLGIAARFVSGYYYLSDVNPEYELHAWTEAYIPGAGWIGLDPTHGLFTENSHIPVCSGAHYDTTMPVTGSVRGTATSEMKTNLNIQVIG